MVGMPELWRRSPARSRAGWLLTVHDVAAEQEEPSARAGSVPASRRLSLRVIRPSEEARAEVNLELLAVAQAGNPVGRCYASCGGSLR
jgi:hypothetical protein